MKMQTRLELMPPELILTVADHLDAKSSSNFASYLGDKTLFDKKIRKQLIPEKIYLNDKINESKHKKQNYVSQFRKGDSPCATDRNIHRDKVFYYKNGKDMTSKVEKEISKFASSIDKDEKKLEDLTNLKKEVTSRYEGKPEDCTFYNPHKDPDNVNFCP